MEEKGLIIDFTYSGSIFLKGIYKNKGAFLYQNILVSQHQPVLPPHPPPLPPTPPCSGPGYLIG